MKRVNFSCEKNHYWRGLSETQLRLTLDPEVIFARVSADQKGASSQR